MIHVVLADKKVRGNYHHCLSMVETITPLYLLNLMPTVFHAVSTSKINLFLIIFNMKTVNGGRKKGRGKRRKRSLQFEQVSQIIKPAGTSMYLSGSHL